VPLKWQEAPPREIGKFFIYLRAPVKPWVPSWRWQASWRWRWRHFNWRVRRRRRVNEEIISWGAASVSRFPHSLWFISKVGSIYFVWPPSLGLSSLDDRSLNINHKERLYFPSRHCPVWPKNLSTSWYDSLKHFGSKKTPCYGRLSKQGQEKANRGRAQTAPTERQPDTTSGTAFESRTQCAASSVDQWPIEIGSGLLPR
jgi:hypothetical protein